VGTVAGSFGEAGRNLQGRFGDDSRTVRGGFEGVLAAEAASGRAGRPRRWRRAGRGASAAGGDGGRILRGSWPEPSGTVRGRFEDGSRWVRGRFGGGSGVRPGRWPRRRRRAGRACQSAGGKPPLRCGSSSVSRRARTAGALADGPGRGVPRERGIRRWNGFRVKPFFGVHLNPARPRAEPSPVPSAPSSQPPQTCRL
jgi:hypothetical protein